MHPPSVRSLSLLSIALILSATPARADDQVPPPPPTPPPAAPPTSPGEGGEPAPGPHHGHMHGMGYSLGDLTDKLGLTADQQKSVGDILNGGQSQMKALRADDSLSRDDKREKMHAIMASTHDQIRAALNPDQQKQFDALPPPAGGHRRPDSN